MTAPSGAISQLPSAPALTGTELLETVVPGVVANYSLPLSTFRAWLFANTALTQLFVPTATADTSTTQAASTAFVLGQAGSAMPLMDAAASVGTSLRYSRQDHAHPVDTTRAAVARQILTGPGLTGGGDLSADRTLAVLANGITNAMFRQSAGLTLVGNQGSTTANVADIIGAANQVPRVNAAGTALAFGAVNLASSAAVTGVLPNVNGGSDPTVPLAGLRNRVINGNFAVNQRGYTSGATLAAAAYGHDRWKAGASGCTYTFSAATPDTTATITAGTLTQVIDATNVEGGTYTLSWTGTATARVYQGAATGAYAASPITVTGLTAGTQTTVEFSTGTLTRVQFEPGSVATVFERRPLSLETALCQAYYWASNPGAPTGAAAGKLAGIAAATTVLNALVRFPVTMRATPTVTFYNNGVSGQMRNSATGTTAAFATSGTNLTTSSLSVFSGSAVLTAGAGYDFDLVASAEL